MYDGDDDLDDDMDVDLYMIIPFVPFVREILSIRVFRLLIGKSQKDTRAQKGKSCWPIIYKVCIIDG